MRSHVDQPLARPRRCALRARTRLALALAPATIIAAAAPARAFHLEDSLHGGTSAGHAVGGAFMADGWHVTDRTDRIWYALPRLASGSVEFTVTNVTNANLGNAESELFAMYEAGYGITEPVSYAVYRDNDYKCMLRVYGAAVPARSGQQKLMWGICPDGAPGYGACACASSFFAEPFGGDGTWDGSPQRIRIEWGGGRAHYLRNGTRVLDIDWTTSGLAYGPSEMHLSLGTARATAVDYAQLPVGAFFSDLVVDGTEGPLSTCPGAPVPDAGAPASDAGASVTDAGPGLTVMDLPVVEDVTVVLASPATVYPLVTDLSTGAGDSEFYVKFRVASLPGRVVRAQLLLNSARDASAAGTGASVFEAASTTWSETTLTWSARPGPRGARLARVDNVTPDQPYAFDVPAGIVTAPGVYAFAVTPEPTDSNTAHFDSKEVSPARGPILRLTIDTSAPPLADAGAPDSGGSPSDSGAAAGDASRGDAGADARRGTGLPPEGGCACRATRPARGGWRAGALVCALLAVRPRPEGRGRRRRALKPRRL